MSLASKKRLRRLHDDPNSAAAAAAAAVRIYRSFKYHYLETEVDGERVGVTLWDSPSLEKNVVDLQLREIGSFIQSKFEETFSEETKVFRTPGVQDTHIHCVFMILDPVRLDANLAASKPSKDRDANRQKQATTSNVIGALDGDFDLQVLRSLRGKTFVIPIISKADTVTTDHMAFLKRTVHEGLQKTGLDPLEILDLGDDQDSDDDNRFDERDEDEDDANNQIHDQHPDRDASRTGGSAHTSDSETLPQDRLSPSPVPMRQSGNFQSSHNANKGNNLAMSAPSSSTDRPLPILPYSILSPDSHSLKAASAAANQGQLGESRPVGRYFPWGFADPHNRQHCDFSKLKETVFGEWRSELRAASKEMWYERWRTERLYGGGSKVSAAAGGKGSSGNDGGGGGGGFDAVQSRGRTGSRV